MVYQKLRYLLAAVLAIICLLPVTPRAQERAIILATATVVSSLSIVGTNNLQFGTVTPGVNKSVDKATIGFAGEWTVTGTANLELALQFNLPDTMYTADSLGTMRIDFVSSDASYSDGTDLQTAPTGILDPNGPSSRRLGPGGEMVVWIGGTVFPRISQTGGDYTAEIQLTVAYTGS